MLDRRGERDRSEDQQQLAGEHRQAPGRNVAVEQLHVRESPGSAIRRRSRSRRSRRPRPVAGVVQHQAEHLRHVESRERALDRRLGRDAGADDHQDAVGHRRAMATSASGATGGMSIEDPVEAGAQRVEHAAHRGRPEQLRRMAGRRPAGSTVSRWSGRRRARHRSRDAPISTSQGRASSEIPNRRCSDGRRRSASSSSTRCWNSCAIVSARFAAVRLLPSPLLRAGDEDRAHSARRSRRA